MKTRPIVWKCPYCLTSHDDTYIRCTGCGNKRADRFAVGEDGQWLSPDPTDGHGKIGCYANPAHPMRVLYQNGRFR